MGILFHAVGVFSEFGIDCVFCRVNEIYKSEKINSN